MKNFVFISAILLMLFNTLNSCKKESTNVYQYKNLLTKQGWRGVTIRQNINNNGWVDIFSTLPTCEKNNILFFKPDYSVIWDEGLTKCNALDSQAYYYGTWELSSDGKKLTTSRDGGTSTDADIYLLDDSNLIILNNAISGRDTSVVEAKYIH